MRGGERGEGERGQKGGGEQWDGMGGESKRVEERGWDELDGEERERGKGGRLGSVPSGRCVNPCDAAILP